MAGLGGADSPPLSHLQSTDAPTLGMEGRDGVAGLITPCNPFPSHLRSHLVFLSTVSSTPPHLPSSHISLHHTDALLPSAPSCRLSRRPEGTPPGGSAAQSPRGCDQGGPSAACRPPGPKAAKKRTEASASVVLVSRHMLRMHAHKTCTHRRMCRKCAHACMHEVIAMMHGPHARGNMARARGLLRSCVARIRRSCRKHM
eukprot:295030-Chlamydomonas_euryale.AAC.3